jgi:hypothetical protein
MARAFGAKKDVHTLANREVGAGWNAGRQYF